MSKKTKLVGFLGVLLLLIFIYAINLSANNHTTGKGKVNFVLTIQDNLVSLKQ